MTKDHNLKDNSRCCAFDKDIDHNIENCRVLKFEVEKLLSQGFLIKFLQRPLPPFERANHG